MIVDRLVPWDFESVSPASKLELALGTDRDLACPGRFIEHLDHVFLDPDSLVHFSLTSGRIKKRITQAT